MQGGPGAWGHERGEKEARPRWGSMRWTRRGCLGWGPPVTALGCVRSGRLRRAQGEGNDARASATHRYTRSCVAVATAEVQVRLTGLSDSLHITATATTTQQGSHLAPCGCRDMWQRGPLPDVSGAQTTPSHHTLVVLSVPVAEPLKTCVLHFVACRPPAALLRACPPPSHPLPLCGYPPSRHVPAPAILRPGACRGAARTRGTEGVSVRLGAELTAPRAALQCGDPCHSRLWACRPFPWLSVAYFYQQ